MLDEDFFIILFLNVKNLNFKQKEVDKFWGTAWWGNMFKWGMLGE